MASGEKEKKKSWALFAFALPASWKTRAPRAELRAFEQRSLQRQRVCAAICR